MKEIKLRTYIFIISILMDKTNFWLSDYKELYNSFDFFPNKNMSRNQLLNTLTRYAIIVIFVLFFIGSNSNWYYIPISILFGCIILYLLDIEKQDSDKIILNKNSHKCREPDINNPYMNVLVTQNDILKPACNDNETLSKSKNFYKFNLYKNSSDVF